MKIPDCTFLQWIKFRQHVYKRVKGNYPKPNASTSRKLASFITLATLQTLSKAQKTYKHALKNVTGSIQNLRYTANPSRPWILNKQTRQQIKLLNTNIKDIQIPQAYQRIEGNRGLHLNLKYGTCIVEHREGGRCENNWATNPKTTHNIENNTKQNSKGIWPESEITNNTRALQTSEEEAVDSGS
jgi:hypothetical protein